MDTLKISNVSNGNGSWETVETETDGKHCYYCCLAITHGRGFARNEMGLAAINLTSTELHLCQMSDSHGFIKTLTKINLFRPNEVIGFLFSFFVTFRTII